MSSLSPDWIARLGEPHQPGSGLPAPRDVFDDIKVTIPNRVDADNLGGLTAFALARDLYAAGYDWEAHDLFDALAKGCLPDTPQRHLLQGLMELALACLKLRAQQPNAAARLVRETERHVIEARGLAAGVDLNQLLRRCGVFRSAILAGDAAAALAVKPPLD